MPLLNKPVSTVVPFSGLGFDLTGPALLAAGTRLERRSLEEPVYMAPPPEPECRRHGYGLMVYLGRETLGS